MPERQDYIVFGQPKIGDAAKKEVMDSLEKGWIGTGPKVERFSEMLAEYTGADHVVPVSSCTAALFLSLRAKGIGRGDEVLVPSLTFCATANVVEHCGATPVLVDVGRDGLIDFDDAERKITEKTKAIIPVHLYGRLVDAGKMFKFCFEHGLEIIEDAAHTLEGRYGEVRIGNSFTPICFSFYATKNITTAEGGAVATNDEELANKIKTLSNHGLSSDAWKRYSDDGFEHYGAVEAGYKFNMTDLQASLGIHQLQKVESWHQRREEIWNRYQEVFGDSPFETPAPNIPTRRHCYHLYTLLAESRERRDVVLSELHSRGVGTGLHYVPVHMQPYYVNKYGLDPENFPVATDIGNRTFSIPLSPHLTDEEVNRVIKAVKEVSN